MGNWSDDETGRSGAFLFGPDGLLMPNSAADPQGRIVFEIVNKKALPHWDAQTLTIDRGGNVEIKKS